MSKVSRADCRMVERHPSEGVDVPMRDDLTLRAEHGQILLDVALQFGATLDLDRLLPLVLERVTDLLNADRALIALTDREGHVQRAVVHNLDWKGPGHPLPVSGTLIRKVIEEGVPEVVADAATDAHFGQNQSVRLFGLRFMMGVPVPAHGRVIGVLYVDSKASKVADLDGETELLVALARLVGTAVENARLFEEQRYRTRLLAQLVHDLRGPLSVVLANGEMLTAGMTDEADLDAAQDVAACARRMSKMVDHTLELSRADAGTRAVEPVHLDLSQAIPRHVKSLELVARQQGLSLDVSLPPELPTVHTIPDRLWIILDNLLFNAIKHARPDSTVTVAGVLRADDGPVEAQGRFDDGVNLFSRQAPLLPVGDGGFVELSVHNEGAPIPPHLLPRLFEAYVRGPTQHPFGSTGLGLSIVEQCTRHLGGCVWVRSSAEAGSRFSFTLPTQVRLGVPARAPADGMQRRDTVPMEPFSTMGGEDTRPDLLPAVPSDE